MKKLQHTNKSGSALAGQDKPTVLCFATVYSRESGFIKNVFVASNPFLQPKLPYHCSQPNTACFGRVPGTIGMCTPPCLGLIMQAVFGLRVDGITPILFSSSIIACYVGLECGRGIGGKYGVNQFPMGFSRDRGLFDVSILLITRGRVLILLSGS